MRWTAFDGQKQVCRRLVSRTEMSQSASQAAAFYRDVAQFGRVWTVKDDGGYPAPKNQSGQRAQPFWSSASRVERIIDGVAAYAGFEPVEISWQEFRDNWVPGLAESGLLVGVNWSGKRATGYDLEPGAVVERVEAARATDAS